MPRGAKKYDRLKSVAQDYDTNEYIITNDKQVFDGDALDLIKAIYKCERIPLRVRLYAASKAAEFEARVDASPGTEDSRVLLYLPDNRRDLPPELRAELQRQRLDLVARRDEQLHEWIASGDLSEAQALMARGQWVEPGDPPWVSVPRQGCDIDENAELFQSIPPRITDCISDTQEPEPEIRLPSPWREVPLPPAVVVLFAPPHACFQAASGKRYEASEEGEILVADSDDRTDLLRAGYRAKR